MRLSKLFTFVAFALLFAAFVFALPSPSFAATNTVVTAEKTGKNAVTVAVGFADTARTFASSMPPNFVNPTTPPPVVLPAELTKIVTPRFYGYQISRAAGKIPIKSIGFNVIARFEPDFIPLD